MAASGEAFSGATQTVSVAGDVAAPDVSHESYVTTTGPETLVESGTNHDWAKLVLIYGDFPLTQANIDVMLRWMRQENGPDNWWNRNNPLNNGNGSGGGSGLGSYATLSIAAEYAADSLRRYSFYDAIEASLAMAQPGDLLLVQADTVDETIDFMRERLVQPQHAREIVLADTTS